jgi:hypothetical protein
MESSSSRDLGSGVRASTLADGSLLVRSAWLPLPWTVREGRATGTAVLVGEDAYEVVAHQRSTRGESWTLEPWPQHEVMRGVVTLGEEWVSRCAHEVALERRTGRLRPWMLLVSPLLGSAPASLQSHWEIRWGFPAVTASVLSALGELVVATFGIVHALSSSLGGSGILPRWLGWIGVLAPALAVEAIIRLKHATAVSEPVGTALLLPLSVLRPTTTVSAAPTAPVVRSLDRDAGRLVIWSPIHRADWVPGGVLSYREEVYTLSSVEREGRDWVYSFGRSDEGFDGPPLRLGPPVSRSTPVRRDRPPALTRTALVTALACLAPRQLQEAWAATIDVHPVLLTVLGAGAECCGGLVNLSTTGSIAASWLLPLNLFFLAEGAVRFSILVSSGRAVGSLPGLALRPFLDRLMAD